MCELLGISRSHEGTARFSFTKLRQESKRHPHGWGIAFYQTHATQKNRSESGTAAIIATKRLTKSDEVWQSFKTRTVYVFQNGILIRPTHIN
ncbi:MAG TPA: class II glutamine amidotransferase [Candidatus Acidoferrum sp.]|nr:class II glutamine amidotransferase [Candidatus Acidoferrum sp.]